jgi:hypothetical protein
MAAKKTIGYACMEDGGSKTLARYSCDGTNYADGEILVNGKWRPLPVAQILWKSYALTDAEAKAMLKASGGDAANG